MQLSKPLLAAGLLLALGASPASAQCGGQFPTGTVCGNPEATTALPKVVAPFQTVKRHSSAETTYTVTSADCGHRLVGTNDANAMIWTIPASTGALALCSNMTVTNVGVAPLFIDNATTASLFNPWTAVAAGTNAGPRGFKRLAISQNQTAMISADGTGNWLADVYSPSKANGYEKSLYTTSYSLSNGGPFFIVNGTPTIGDTVGFDYTYETTPGGPGTNTLQFRYTFTTNTVAELETAAQSLIAQMKNNASLVAVTGPDQAQYFVAVQTTPLPNPQWLVAMNQVWPFNPNNHPRATVVNTPPGHTATITFLNDLGGGSVSSVMDIGSWFGCTRGTIYAGRQPQVGDRICGFFVGGEVTGYPINNHDYQPIYASFQWWITDPTPGINAATMLATAQNFDFNTTTGSGLGALSITGSLSANVNRSGMGGGATPAGTVAQFFGADSNGAFVTARAYAGSPALVLQAAGGTGAVPVAIGGGANIGGVSFGGYAAASTFTQSASINATASETYTAAHSGSRLDFFTTPTGTNAITRGMTLSPFGSLSVGTQVFDTSTAIGRIAAVSNTSTGLGANLLSGTRFYGATLDGFATVSMLESFVAGNTFAGRTSGGTAATPSATPLDATLVTLNGYGFTNALSPNPNGAVAISANSLWSAANAATRIGFFVTPTGSTTLGEQMRLQQSGCLSVGTTTACSAGTVVANARVGIVNASPKTLMDANANAAVSPALINANSVGRYLAPDGVTGNFEVVSYGSAGVSWIGGAAGGTAASPTATPVTTSLTSFGGYGWNGSAWSLGAAMVFSTGSQWSGSNQETAIIFYATASGSTSFAEAARITSGGSFAVGVTTNSGAGTVQLKKQAFGSLTACGANIEGAMASVTDSSTAVWGNTVTGGGANHVLAYCNATNWTVAAK